jgi:hypothetical protein
MKKRELIFLTTVDTTARGKKMHRGSREDEARAAARHRDDDARARVKGADTEPLDGGALSLQGAPTPARGLATAPTPLLWSPCVANATAFCAVS